MTPPAYRSGISVRQQPRDPFVRAVPMVRIRFPPAVSPLRTRCCATLPRPPQTPPARTGRRYQRSHSFVMWKCWTCGGAETPEFHEAAGSHFQDIFWQSRNSTETVIFKLPRASSRTMGPPLPSSSPWPERAIEPDALPAGAGGGKANPGQIAKAPLYSTMSWPYIHGCGVQMK